MTNPTQGRGIPNLDEKALSIFTDGSSLGSPRSGGCAFVVVWFDESGEMQTDEAPASGYAGATSNEMELRACTEALRDIQSRHTGKDLSQFSKVVIYTDSMYVAEYVGHAQTYWPKNGWRNRDDKPIDNVQFWKELVKEIKRISRDHHKRVEIKWHEGHNKHNPLNKRADHLAKEAAKSSAPKKHLRPANVAPKLSPKSTEVGSVKMKGQLMTIRIIEHKHFREQRAYKYRYEVMNADSPYYQNVDFIFSRTILNRQHCYLVRVNDTTKNPWIDEVIEQIDPDDASMSAAELHASALD